MKKASLLDDYLIKYAASSKWHLLAKSTHNIKQAIVIPAYNELEMIFDTLSSISDNPESSLDMTLVVCVVNNKADASEEVRQNNFQTLKILTDLIYNHSYDLNNIDRYKRDSIEKIVNSRIRLGCIDASSPELEIPQKVGGVGMARKIGMDMALRTLQKSDDDPRLIMSLDADTLVEPNYLPAIRDEFSQNKISTGVVRYKHQMPSDAAGCSAICAYETYLRYWVWGLKYAGSPYAFHSIGSTMVTTSEAYLSVRGMNRREAGEDFYFLNKLAKVDSVHNIKNTTVYPSARVSGRVPFGTGAAVRKISAYGEMKHNLYDPRIFVILKAWLDYMKNSFLCNEEQILMEANCIHEGLKNFLVERKFLSVWPKIRQNIKDPENYTRHFHGWFDGFETLKLINYMTREYYPKIDMRSVIETMMQLNNDTCPMSLKRNEHLKVLEYMRSQ